MLVSTKQSYNYGHKPTTTPVCPGLMMGKACMKYEHLVDFHRCVFFSWDIRQEVDNLETRHQHLQCTV